MTRVPLRGRVRQPGGAVGVAILAVVVVPLVSAVAASRAGLPLVEVGPGWAAVVGGSVWGAASFVVGYVAHRAPVARLDHDGPVTRLRPVERDGRIYERWLRVSWWKRWLPEGGAFYDGGVDKRRLPGRTDADLERFAVETRRAELTHWTLLVLAPTFLLWCPTPVAAAMVGFGVVANMPFALVQRYNRARMARLREARARRRVESGAAPPSVGPSPAARVG
jgi:glycosyl-4,4'-diaponeurosporenoate acyltransferase